ncbi:MAG: transketolase [Clostridia bacterium]|nr:transketolase [Clostridia bacterium]
MLGVDAVNRAKSGHPGIVLGAAPMTYTLYSRHIKVNPRVSNWFNRDRFILSAGHGSALLYSMLHLSGYDVKIEDLKEFRQWNSLTPGHPEFGHTDGVDATTGPLGQGIAMATGIAIAEKFLGARFNKDGMDIIDHYSYVLCGDGDLQEGVAQEAMSLAGHLGLGKLIVLYDSNDIQLDGSVSMANSEDTRAKYEAINWQYIKVSEGTNVGDIDKAIAQAKANIEKPTLIEIRTEIGYGSPLVGDSASHGAPLGEENTKATREALGWPHEPFLIPSEIYSHFERVVKERGQDLYNQWSSLFDQYKNKYPESADEIDRLISGKLEIDFENILETYEVGHNEATRATGGKVLKELSKVYPFLVGGSADLTKSTKAKGVDGDFTKDNPLGRNINYGVREHAMGAIVNGMTLHGLRGFGGTFFVFSDYMKPSIRLAALMNIPSVFVFTHDSVAVGEDGPTHEPIEQLAGLRAIPNLDVIRPADANEVVAAWRLALESKSIPTAIVLTRQGVETVNGTSYEGVKAGGYVVSYEKEEIHAILIATGSEVNLALKAQEELLKEGIDSRVVSLPSFKRFKEQSDSYREGVLPSNIRIRLAIEMGSSLGWGQFIGLDGRTLTIDRFGASAPNKIIVEKYGFTVENVIKLTKELIAKIDKGKIF